MMQLPRYSGAVLSHRDFLDGPMSNAAKNSKLVEILAATPARILVSLVVPVVTFLILNWSFVFMRDANAPRLLIALIALIVGVGGVWLLFLAMNHVVFQFPVRIRDTLLPYVFVGPALVVLLAYIVFPSMRTVYLSFLDRRMDEFVGLDNYIFAFTDPSMLVTLRNTFLWLILVPAFAVSLGLIIAVIVDRMSPTAEKISKSLIFLPLAISFVGASVIWRFIYFYQPPGSVQTGLLNAIVTSFGMDPQGWLVLKPWNNLFLIVIMIWLQTGFAMVILSSAVKGVPSDLLDAARIDGAGEIRVFFNVIIPYVSGTILTVTTTILILVLKIFDVVFVMTSGQYETGVVAFRMYQEAFVFRNFGRGSALATLLFIGVMPIMIRNMKEMKERRR
jgi:alpha-glucoside transport system permease protein